VSAIHRNGEPHGKRNANPSEQLQPEEPEAEQRGDAERARKAGSEALHVVLAGEMHESPLGKLPPAHRDDGGNPSEHVPGGQLHLKVQGLELGCFAIAGESIYGMLDPLPATAQDFIH
jgi:hypothetical protein